VVIHHGAANAMLPTVTVVGLQIGSLFGGAVVTEVVFNYPGLGRLLFNAVVARDYPVIQGAVMFIVLVFLVLNLLVDLLYALLDPRVRVGNN
jgi:peptide/nickel transport system permease protein